MEKIVIDPRVVRFDQLTPFHIKSLCGLTNNFDHDGSNSSLFSTYIGRKMRGESFPRSYVARARVAMTMKVIGWSLFHILPDEHKAEAGFYVSAYYRRKGIGSMLYKRVMEACHEIGGVRRLITEPWTSTGDRFFRSQGVTVTQEWSPGYIGECESVVRP